MFQGWIPTPQRHRSLLFDKMDRAMGFHELRGSPVFGAAFSELPKVAMPYLSVEQFLPGSFEKEAQVGPDCTTHAIRNAANVSRANEILIAKELEEFRGQLATELCYAYRGHRGAGMNPGRAIDFYVKYGMLLRDRYSFADLTEYGHASFGWASKLSSLPEEALQQASLHPFRHYAKIRSVDELRVAIAAGYGVIHGSQYGTKDKRGPKGRCAWNDSWNHCMCIGGYEETDDLYFLNLNSWGKWNSGPHPDCGPIPGGSMMVSADTMVKTWKSANTETWALGNSHGFPAQKLPNYGTGGFL